MKKKISVIIPNWNGKDLLKKNMPPLLHALKFYESPSEIIIVDDGSTDDSVPFLKSNYSQIKVIELGENRGFSAAANEGVKSSKGDFFLLLNSDIEVTETFLDPLLLHFEDKSVFAVASKAVAGDKKSILSGRCGIEFKRGLLQMKREEGEGKLSYTFRASGGHSVFDRAKFLELGGFDELFSPFYSEDEDICYRAWKRGWKVIYEPSSTVIHCHQSTIGKAFNKSYIELVFRRNKLLFFWKNITDRYFLLQHILYIPIYLILGLFLRPYLSFSFLVAFVRISKALKNRKNEKKFFKLKDREVIELIQNRSY